MGRASRARAGYTLVELMMIVLIIAISVVAFTPGFSRAMADRRVSSAARELIRIGRRARSDTFGYLRAHLVWIDPVARQVQLLRGPTNSCALTDWVNVATDCPAAVDTVPGGRCLENLFLSAMAGSDQPIGLFEETTQGTSYSTLGRALCYAPSGVVSWGRGDDLTAATVTTRLSTANSAAVAGGFIFALVNGTAAPITASVTTRTHRVLFSLGGTARSIR